MTEQTEQSIMLPPVKLAIIIDNKVVDIMHTDSRFAAILLSSPVVVDITPENDEDQLRTYVGDTYDSESSIFEYESAKSI